MKLRRTTLFVVLASVAFVGWAPIAPAVNPSAARVGAAKASDRGGLSYISSGAKVYALDTVTGSKVWDTAFTGSVDVPVASAGVVYVGGDTLYALNPSTGAKLWTYSHKTWGPKWFPRYTSPAFAGGLMYVGGSGVSALNPSTHALLWTFHKTNGWYSSAATGNGVVYVTSREGGPHAHSWTSTVYALNGATGALIWTHANLGFTQSAPSVAGSIVYVSSQAGAVYALNASTGATLWSFATGKAFVGTPAAAAGVVYVGSVDGTLYALDAATGKQRWALPLTTGAILQAAVVAGGTIYVADDSYNLFALDASTGAQRWTNRFSYYVASLEVRDGVVYLNADRTEFALDAGTGAKRWSYTNRDEIWSSPVVADHTVYVDASNGRLYAVNRSTGVPNWNFAVGGIIVSAPAVSGRVAFVGGSTGNPNLYAVDAGNGKKIWETNLDGYASAPVVDGGIVYAVANGRLYAVDRSTGAKLWNVGELGLSTSPVIVNHVLFIAGDSWIYALNATTGALVWRSAVKAVFHSPPVVSGGMVYAPDEGNKVYALNALTGALKWSFKTRGWNSPLAVVKGIVYVAISKDPTYRHCDVYALRARNGTKLWMRRLATQQVESYYFSAPVVSKHVVYAGLGNRIYALGLAKGKLLWRYPVGGQVSLPPAIVADNLYVGSTDGRLYDLHVSASKAVMKWKFGVGGPSD